MNRLSLKGLALVEFAVLLPLLLVIIFGITELGRALYQLNTLTKATDSGVRYLSRAWGALDGDCNPGPRWEQAQDATRALVVYGNPAGTGAPLLPGLSTGEITIDVRGSAVPGSARAACVITVSAATPFNALSGEQIIPFTNIGPVTLRTSKEGRYLAR